MTGQKQNIHQYADFIITILAVYRTIEYIQEVV